MHILVLHQNLIIYNYPIAVLGAPMQVDLDELAYVSETTLTIRGSRRRTTVPKDIVDALGMQDGDRIRWALFRDGRILLTRVRKGR
jgi:hypothetical protein